MRRKSIIAIAAAALLASVAPASAATLQQVGSFSSPVFVTSDPNDASRLFVVERGGAIRLIAGGATSTFLDVGSLAVSGGEQGLLSMAFAPDYATSGRYYIYYTARPDGDIQIDEFTASGDFGNPASRRPVLTVPHGQAGNHNGGQLQFAPDGYLYIGTGDGGGAGDTFRNARTSKRCSASSSASTRGPAATRPTRYRRTTRSSVGPARTRSGALACATPSASPSIARRERSRSAMSAKA